MYRSVFMGLSLLFTVHASPVQACSIRAYPALIAIQAAANATLISGEVVQEYDPETNRPQIVRANAVFIGDPLIKDYKFRVPEWQREQMLKARKAGLTDPMVITCGYVPLHKKGHSFERLLLKPVDRVMPFEWNYYLQDGGITQGANLDIFIEEAKKTGRFRVRPPEKVAPITE